MKRLFARLFPPRGRHREPRMDNTGAGWTPTPDANWYWTGPDAGPAAPTVHLPAVLDPGTRHGPAGHMPTADRQPTTAPSTTDTAVTTMEHVGATEDWSPVAEIGLDDEASLDPDEHAWQRTLTAFEAAGELAAARSLTRLHAELDRFAPGWRGAICGRPRCARCAHNFDEAREMAGVHALPAVAVDYSTAEYPVLVMV